MIKNIQAILLILQFIPTPFFAQDWTYSAKLVASDREIEDRFGVVAIDGNYAVVGAYNEDHDANGNNEMTDAGAAYIFEIDSNGDWTEVQKIVASDRSNGDAFGLRVAVNNDRIIVSSPLDWEDENGQNPLPLAGSAYIFERDVNGTWIEVQKIVAHDRVVGHAFGASVDIENDISIVGTAGDNEGAYVFERDGNGIWIEIQKLVPIGAVALNDFGYGSGISGDYIIVGAPFENFDENGANSLPTSGAAYIYKKDVNGNWNQVQKIVASDRDEYDRFASKVAVYNDYAIFGAYTEDDDENGANFKDAAGSAYIFKRDVNGVWTETQKVVASDRDTEDRFGLSVSIGSRFAVVGAFNEDHDIFGLDFKSNSGSAYIYEKDSNESWNEVHKITSPIREDEDLFGVHVAIDNSTILIGSTGEDEDEFETNTALDAGSVYVFEFDGILNNVESNFEKQIKVYPNPTSKDLTINLGQTYDLIKLTITNVLGESLEIRNFKNTDVINFELDKASGIYFMNVSTSQWDSVNFKIIKE